MKIRLVYKLAFALTVGTALVLATYGWLAVRREMQFFERSQREYAEVLGHVLARQMAERWREHGMQVAIESLGRFDGRDREIDVRWISFADPLTSFDPEIPSAALGRLEAGEVQRVVKKHPDTGAIALHTYIPVPLDEKNSGAVEIVESHQKRTAYTDSSVQRLLVALAVCVGVIALITAALSALIIGRPIDKLITKAQQVGAGDLDKPVALHGGDELGELAEAMTDMGKSLAEARARLASEEQARRVAERELRHADRLATLGRLAAGVAHEIGTPLNVISGRAKRLQKGTEDETQQKNAAIIREQAERITAIMRKLLGFARRRGSDIRTIRISDLFAHTAELLGTTLRKSHGVTLVASVSEPSLAVAGDDTQLQQVLTNLSINAAQAMPDGGEVNLRAELGTFAPPADHGGGKASFVRITVEDAGTGIPAENLNKVFDPFFTTKDVGEGTGLGLAVVYGIVKDHRGWVAVESEPGRGTVFSVFLPQPETEETA